MLILYSIQNMQLLYNLGELWVISMLHCNIPNLNFDLSPNLSPPLSPLSSPDGSCPPASELCDEQPCPGDMQCVGTGATRVRYACQCPPGKLGECAGVLYVCVHGCECACVCVERLCVCMRKRPLICSIILNLPGQNLLAALG